MSRATLKAIQAAAGNAAGEAIYVEDVFSTYLYNGNNTERDIQNGLDLGGEGGLVWIKDRASGQHVLSDTENGANKYLSSSSSAALTNSIYNEALKAFNSDGFKLPGTVSGSDPNRINGTGYEYVSWSFRKQPGFFDIVTYTGTSTSPTDTSQYQDIPHNLGTTPGMIIVKNLDDASQGWVVNHRSLSGASQYMRLDTSSGVSSSSKYFGNNLGFGDHSSTFRVVCDDAVNNSGDEYVAYLFAHDAQDFGADSDEAIIKCGGYTGTGSAQDINLGFEPQWVLIKRKSSASWILLDSMRGIAADGVDPDLHPDDNNYESQQGAANFAELNSDGIEIDPGSNGWGGVNANGIDYIYVAIRRPHKPASEFGADELFETVAGSGNPAPNFISGFPVDMYFNRKPATSPDNWDWSSRLTQGRILQSNLTNAESTNADFSFDYQNGVMSGGYTSTLQSWMFRRAPGFFDVVTYTGTGSSPTTIDHNLGAVPEMVIIKARNKSSNWVVYHSGIGNTGAVYLQSSGSEITFDGFWNDTTPTDSVFTLGNQSDVNENNRPMIAYLFATVPGISKVGSYSGTGSNLTIDCGFSSGARFVLIKSTTFAGGWHLWDSVRGITTGNDYYIKLNGSGAQTTDGVVDIEPDSSGFILNGPNANINSSGEEYIFLAIA